MAILEKIPSTDLSLIWGNLRNLVDLSTVEFPNEITLTGTIVGEFPIDSYHPIFLEIPRTRKKMDISGRSNYCSSIRTNKIDWSFIRIVSLPIYKVNQDNMSIECLKLLFKSWQYSLIPEDIPCSALAIKTVGLYCDERRGQYIAVLLIWPDSTARVLELDWFEGPLEDCITPEWYIFTSEWLSLKIALAVLKETCTHPSYLKNSGYSVFINPLYLGNELQGDKKSVDCDCWKYEWRYANQPDLIKDLDLISIKIKKILKI